MIDVADRASACDPQNPQDPQGVGSHLHAGKPSVEVGMQARREAILSRLLRWGWTFERAALTADRIARREPDDDRRTCPECRHSAPGRCREHRRAGLSSGEVGRDLAGLPQRCPGFEQS